MKHYAIFSDHSGKEGVPVFFEARMFEAPIKGNAFDKENTISYDWMKKGFNDYKLKDEFYLYSKSTDLDFDYYEFANDFILSETFLALIDKYQVQYAKHPVHIYDAKDNTKLNLRKKYFFVKFDYAKDVVDFENSVYESSMSDKGEPIHHNGVKYVKAYTKIELIEKNIPSEVFLIKDVKLGFNLFCTEAFKADAEKTGIYGVIFVPLEEFIDFTKYSGFLGKETYERLKNRDQLKAINNIPKAENAITVTNSHPPGTPTFVYRDLTEEEEKEINRLIGRAEDLLNTEAPNVVTLLDKLNTYISVLKLEKTQNDDLAYELGSLYGRLVTDQYSWHWIYVTVDGKGAFCVRSPDKRFACKIHNYISSLLTTDKPNNLKLLFHLLDNPAVQETANELTFLN